MPPEYSFFFCSFDNHPVRGQVLYNKVARRLIFFFCCCFLLFVDKTHFALPGVKLCTPSFLVHEKGKSVRVGTVFCVLFFVVKTHLLYHHSTPLHNRKKNPLKYRVGKRCDEVIDTLCVGVFFFNSTYFFWDEVKFEKIKKRCASRTMMKGKDAKTLGFSLPINHTFILI